MLIQMLMQIRSEDPITGTPVGNVIATVRCMPNLLREIAVANGKGRGPADVACQLIRGKRIYGPYRSYKLVLDPNRAAKRHRSS